MGNQHSVPAPIRHGPADDTDDNAVIRGGLAGMEVKPEDGSIKEEDNDKTNEEDDDEKEYDEKLNEEDANDEEEDNDDDEEDNDDDFAETSNVDDEVIPAKVVVVPINSELIKIEVNGTWTYGKTKRCAATMLALASAHATIVYDHEKRKPGTTFTHFKWGLGLWMLDLQDAVDEFGLGTVPSDLRNAWRISEMVLSKTPTLSRDQEKNPNAM